jgi:hypothetical protein
MTKIFNEWAERYARDPDSFLEVLGPDGKPVEDYGLRCTLYFTEIAYDMDEKGLLPLAAQQPAGES